MTAASSEVILEPKKIKSVTVSTFPHLFAMKWWDQMPWSWFFWMLSFKSVFSFSSLILIKRLYFLCTFCHWGGGVICISEVVDISRSNLDSSLWFIQPNISHDVLCISRWQYSAFSYSFPNFEPFCCCMSSSNCCFLTYIQISQEAGKVVWYSHLFKNFPVCCNPHSHRLLHSQWSRSGCFFWIPVTVVPDDSPDLFLFLSEAWRKLHLSRVMRLVLASETQVLGLVSLPGCGI